MWPAREVAPIGQWAVWCPPWQRSCSGTAERSSRWPCAPRSRSCRETPLARPSQSSSIPPLADAGRHAIVARVGWPRSLRRSCPLPATNPGLNGRLMSDQRQDRPGGGDEQTGSLGAGDAGGKSNSCCNPAYRPSFKQGGGADRSHGGLFAVWRPGERDRREVQQ